MRTNRRRFHPNLELLDQRVVLSTYGNPWPNPSDISISFTPDGTTDGTQQSSLSGLLDDSNNSGNTNNDWQLTLLRAFQTWSTQANINFTVSSDNGSAFGVTGAIQGDSRFGDIRIGAISQSPSTYALTQPFSYGSGTWAGDVNLNSNATFGTNNPNSVDLFTVALHEAGHSLGLDVTATDTTSVMYQYYTGLHTTLSTSDIAAIQAIYGAGTDTSNNSFATATPIYPVNVLGLNASSPSVTIQDRLSTQSSADYFVVNTALNPGPVHVQLKTSGISLLDSTITVYDANHNILGTTTATDPRSGDISVALPGLTARTNYYFSVQGAHNDAFNVGAYQVRVLPDSVSWAPTVNPLIGPDFTGFVNGDDVNLTASSPLSLPGSTSQTGPHNYFYPASLTALGQARYYSFTSPSSIPSGSQDVVTILVWGVDSAPVDSVATVYDAKMKPISSTVIEHTNGTYIIQVPNAAVNSTYIVKVAASDHTNPLLIGNFDLAINFANTVEAQYSLGNGQLSSSSTSSSSSITLSHDTLYNFILSVDPSKQTTLNAAVLKVTASNGSLITTMQTKPTQTQSLQIWLKAGTYKISIASLTSSFGTTCMNWTLNGEDLSAPIKVYGGSGAGSSPPTS